MPGVIEPQLSGVIKPQKSGVIVTPPVHILKIDITISSDSVGVKNATYFRISLIVYFLSQIDGH